MRASAGWILFAVAAMPPAMAAVAADAVRLEQADVFAADGARLLYRESHYVLRGDRPQRWVLYRCPDGRAFARKQVQATPLPMAPSFALVDGRDGFAEGVRGSGASRIAYAGARDAQAAAPVAVPANGVVDAGFDVAVRTHWNDLMRNRTVRLQFLVPSRKRFFPVRVERVGGIAWNGIPAERLRMRVDAWFGFAVPAVELVYSRADQRLLEFKGTGNVRDANGRNPQVRISFRAAPTDVPLGDLAAARALPLDGGCRF